MGDKYLLPDTSGVQLLPRDKIVERPHTDGQLPCGLLAVIQ